MADGQKKPRRSKRIPSHRRHATGQGVVTLGGKDFYTGVWGTPKSEQRYRELIGEWISNDRKILPAPKKATVEDLGISVAELCLRFTNWARSAYSGDDGERRPEFAVLERTAKRVSELFGLIPAATFSRKHFHQLRDEFIRARLARSYVNFRMQRVKTIFTWGANRELIPFEVAARIAAIPKLKPGEEGVRETAKVEPVSSEIVEKTLPHLRPQLQAFVRILRLTGARSGELCILRPCDLTPTDDPEVHLYRPSKHKTQMHQSREIFIGPQARKILAPYLEGVAPTEYVFRAARKKRPLDPQDVGQAVKWAADKAKVKRWHVHRLRHAKLSEERQAGNIDVAQLLAGHSSSTMTERYARPDVSKAIEATKKRG